MIGCSTVAAIPAKFDLFQLNNNWFQSFDLELQRQLCKNLQIGGVV
jgi:hypothetical protein